MLYFKKIFDYLKTEMQIMNFFLLIHLLEKCFVNKELVRLISFMVNLSYCKI